MKRFILFDHDGVLVETEPWFYESNVQALEEIGVRFSREQYLKLMADGISCWSLAEHQNIPEADIVEARNRRNGYYQGFLISEDIEIPGVLETLEELADHFKMGIVTTAKRQDFDLIHKHRSILHWMEFALTQEDYEKKKPLPDPYLAGLDQFGASPQQAIVVEDSARGLKSAVSAGIDCVIVKSEFIRQHDFSGAALVIDKFRDLPKAIDSFRA